MNYENVRKSVAKVSIFYNDLRETVITENVKISMADLISSIGGTLGLFVGMSLLSSIEILEILVQSAIVLLKQNRRIDQKKY
jgi:energy-converting hydrogenase Eha subunit G